MEQDVKLGEAAGLQLKLADGKASVTAVVDLKVVLEALRKEVDGKLPAEAPAIDTVFGWLEAALVAVK